MESVAGFDHNGRHGKARVRAAFKQLIQRLRGIRVLSVNVGPDDLSACRVGGRAARPLELTRREVEPLGLSSLVCLTLRAEVFCVAAEAVLAPPLYVG